MSELTADQIFNEDEAMTVNEDFNKPNDTLEAEEVKNADKNQEEVNVIQEPESDQTIKNDDKSSEIEAFKRAAIDERKKRQELESRINSMQNPIEKPDAYTNTDEAIQFSQNEVEQRFTARLLDMSEAQAKLRHSDFDAMSDVFFNELAISNPSLSQQAMNAPDPYEFVYQQAKNHNEFKEVGSIDDYKAKIRNEILAEMKGAESLKAEKEANEAINNALPNSLSTKTAIGGNTVPAQRELTMEEILG